MDNPVPKETSAEQNYFCDICSLEYLNKNDLEEHKWSLLHHKKLDKEKGRDYIHKCTLCDEDIFGLLSFTKHIHGDEHQKKLQDWKTSTAEPTTLAESMIEANEPPLWAGKFQRFPRWMAPGGQYPNRPVFYRPAYFQPHNFPPPHSAPRYYHQHFMQQQQQGVIRHRNKNLRYEFHDLSPPTHRQPVTVHNGAKSSNPVKGHNGSKSNTFHYHPPMSESYMSTSNEASFSIASEPSINLQTEDLNISFEATRKMREKFREINNKLIQIPNQVSSQSLSSQIISLSIDSGLQKSNHGFSRDVVAECQDSFKVISRDSENVDSVVTRKDPKEKADTEIARSRQMEEVDERSRNSECPFVGSKEEEVLATFVAANLWNGNLIDDVVTLEKDQSQCSNRAVATGEASLEDVHIANRSKTDKNGNYNKNQSSGRLSDNPPASSALKDLLIFTDAFQNRNTVTVDVLSSTPPISYATAKLCATNGHKDSSSTTQAIPMKRSQPSRASVSGNNNVYSQSGTKSQPDLAQRMNVFTERSEPESSSVAVKKVSYCTNSSTLRHSLHKMVSSQTKSSDSFGDIMSRSCPTMEVSLPEVSTVKRLSVSIANIGDPQRSSDTSANIIEHLKTLLRERLPREEPATEQTHQSEPVSATFSGGNVVPKETDTMPIFAKDTKSVDEDHNISIDCEDKQATGNANTSLETSILSLDESLKSSNLSNQCEFRYKDGRRCPTSAEQKFCTYHAKVVRDVFIHHARATALQKSQTEPDHQPSSAKEGANPSTHSVPCSVADTAASTPQPSSNVGEASREQHMLVSSSDVSSITLSDSEDALSLQSRFRYLHKATKNPLSGLDLSRTNLPPNIRKLLNKRCSGDTKNATDGEATSSSCQNPQRANINDIVNDITSVAAQEQSPSITSSAGVLIPSASGNVDTTSKKTKSPVGIHPAGVKHTVAVVRDTGSSVVFSHNDVSLQSSTNSSLNNGILDARTSNRNPSLSADNHILVTKETIVSDAALVFLSNGSVSSNSCSRSHTTLENHRNFLTTSSTSEICLQVSNPAPHVTCHAAKTIVRTSFCVVYTLPKETSSFVAHSLSTYTVNASISDLRDGTYHRAVESHKNNGNGNRDIYRLATGVTSSPAQASVSSQKQVDDAHVALAAKRSLLNTINSSISAAVPISNICVEMNNITTTTTTGMSNLDKGPARCLGSEVTQTVDICKTPKPTQSCISLLKDSNILEGGTAEGRKIQHEGVLTNSAQSEGEDREIAEQEASAKASSHCARSKEHATCLADSVQLKASIYSSNSPLEVDANQRTMLRTFFDNLKRKKENRKEKENMQMSGRTGMDVPVCGSTGGDDDDRPLLPGNKIVANEKSNCAFCKVEGKDFSSVHQRVEKDSQPLKRKVMAKEASELKRRRIEKGEIAEVRRHNNLKKKELLFKNTLETTRKRKRGVVEQIMSLEKILKTCCEEEKKLEKILKRISKEKHRMRVSLDRNGKSVVIAAPKEVPRAQNSSDTLTKIGGSDTMEQETMNSLSSGSSGTLHDKDIDKKAKKKKWKNFSNNVSGKNFNDRTEAGFNNVKDKISIVRSPSLWAANNIDISASLQNSSSDEIDSLIVKRSFDKKSSIIEERSIPIGSSKIRPLNGKSVSCVSTSALKTTNNALSRSVIGSLNGERSKLIKDLFQFQSEDDMPVNSHKKKRKSNSRKLKSPSFEHTGNCTMQSRSSLSLDGKRSLRVQLTDIASLMLDKGIKLCKPYESPIASLKNKFDMLSDNIETNIAGHSQGYVENQEKVNADVERKAPHFDDESMGCIAETREDVDEANDENSIFESTRKCVDKENPREHRFRSPSKNENESESDSLHGVGSTKKSLDSTDDISVQEDVSLPVIVECLNERNAKKAHSIDTGTIDGKNSPQCLGKPAISNTLLNNSSISSASDKSSDVENRDSCLRNVEELILDETSEASMPVQDGIGSSSRIETSEGTLSVTDSSTNVEGNAGEEIVSRNQTQLSADKATIVIENSSETVTNNVDNQGATNKRKRSEGFDNLPLDVSSNKEKKPCLKSHASDCEMPVRTRDSEEGIGLQSILSKNMESDVWKEASTRLKALISKSLNRKAGKSDGSLLLNTNRTVDQSPGNHETPIREDKKDVSTSQRDVVISSHDAKKNGADLISKLLQSGYWSPPQEAKVYKPHGAAITDLQFYHGILYSSSTDRTIKVHNAKNLHLSFKDRIACKSPVRCIEIHCRDKKPMLIAGCSDEIFCYDLYTLQCRGKHSFSAEVEALHVRFGNLYVGSSDGSIFVISLKRMCRTDSMNFDDYSKCIDGKWNKRAVKSIKSAVVCQNEGNLKRLLIILFEGLICILDAMNLDCIKTFAIQSLCLGVHKKRFYCGFENGELHYGDLEELKEPKKFCKQHGEVMSMKVAGDLLITSSSDFLIRFFSISTAKLLQVYGGQFDISTMETIPCNQITVYSGNKYGEIRSFVADLNKSIVCEWENCGLPFGIVDQLKTHILYQHFKNSIHDRRCKWKSCTHTFSAVASRKEIEDSVKHIDSHLEVILP